MKKRVMIFTKITYLLCFQNVSKLVKQLAKQLAKHNAQVPREERPAGPKALAKVTKAMDVKEAIAQHANLGGKARETKMKADDRSAVGLEQLKINEEFVIQDPKTNTWSKRRQIHPNGRPHTSTTGNATPHGRPS